MAFKLKNIAKLAALATAGFCGVSSSYLTNNFNSNHADLKSLFSARTNTFESFCRENSLFDNETPFSITKRLNENSATFDERIHLVNNELNVEKVLSQIHDKNEQGRQQQASERLKSAVERSKHLVWAKLYEDGIPGLVIAVSVDGKITWKHGFGYADVENRVLANSNTVMRIASISKSITAAAVGKLVEDGLLDLDKPVSEYVEAWPKHHPPISTRQLISHMSGIRHYEKHKSDSNKNTSKNNASNDDVQSKKEEDLAKSNNKNCDNKAVKDKKSESNPGEGDTKYDEFYLNKKFNSVTESLDLFKNDPLLHEPGTKFHYTTHGFTLLSAVIESVTGQKFEEYIKIVFKDLGLSNTCLDENDTIVYNRSKYYLRDKNHKLINAPNVDNSYKWAGGGFLSNVTDLAKFGNAMLYSYQIDDHLGKKESAPQEGFSVSSKANGETGIDGSTKTVKNVRTFDISSGQSVSDSYNDFEEDDDLNSDVVAPYDESNVGLFKKEGDYENIDIYSESDVNYNQTDEYYATKKEEGDRPTVGYDIVYRPGPYANVNLNVANQDETSKGSVNLPRKGFLKQDTVKMLWSPVVPYSSSSSEKKSLVKTDNSDKAHYGMGWAIMPPSNRYAFCKDQRCFVSHTGGAMGASSVLLILPKHVPKENETFVNNKTNDSLKNNEKNIDVPAQPPLRLPEGVVVSIICNTSNVGMTKLALDIAKVFETLRPATEHPYRVQKVYQC